MALGHRRLSIVGLDNGDAANRQRGRHSPYRRKRRILRLSIHPAGTQARGHRFRTRSDSEVALHLYEEHGVGCLRYLRGEFAFVLWDAARRRLFAARDRFGIKPLYYLYQSDRLLLASEVKSLIGAGYRPTWDCESFFLVSALQYLLPDRSLFQGVRQLPRATASFYEEGKLASNAIGISSIRPRPKPRRGTIGRSAEAVERVPLDSSSMR